MATQIQIDQFIDQIAPLVQKYAKAYGYKVASSIIAQACCESAYGQSWISKAPYFNIFGMKCGSSWTGRSVSAKTKEEYTVGTLTSIVDNFRAYDSMEEGVEGYFKFISAKRYANLKEATTAQQYLEMIKADGYATSSTYVETNMSIVNKYNLTIYDEFDSSQTETPEDNTIDLSVAGFRNLQGVLLDLGFKGSNGNDLTIDGIFGNNSKYALECFCRWYLGE